jgi:hypothetical protein
MAGLQDLLMLQQLQQRTNPLYALAEGVSRGIEEGRQEAKQKKESQNQLNLFLKMNDSENQNTNSNKIQSTIIKPTITTDEKGRIKTSITRVTNPKFSKQQTSVSSISNLDINTLPKNIDEQQKEEILGQLPSDIAENVKAAGEYRLDATKLYGLRNNSGDRAKFDALVNKLYPGWDMKKYSQQQGYVNDLASGQLNKQVISLNTLAKHLTTFEQTVDSLKNTNVKPQNAVINMAKNITGDPTITDFNMAREIVYSELQRTVTGAAVTQEGLNRVDKILSPNAGYNQMEGNIKILKEIVKGRIKPLQTQYKNIMGKDESGQILFPESSKIFNNPTANDNVNTLRDQYNQLRSQGVSAEDAKKQLGL